MIGTTIIPNTPHNEMTMIDPVKKYNYQMSVLVIILNLTRTNCVLIPFGCWNVGEEIFVCKIQIGGQCKLYTYQLQPLYTY